MEPEEINPLDNLERLDYGELALPAAAEGEDEEDRQEQIQDYLQEKAEGIGYNASDLPLTAITKGIDNVLGSNLTGTYIENHNQGREYNEQRQEQIEADTGILAEGTRAVIGGAAGVVENAVNFADLTGDLIKQQFIEEDETQNVFSDEYERSEFNLGIAENKTAIGGFARNAITMLGLMKGARFIPGLGGIGVGAKSTVATRLTGETIRGAIADFIMDEGDGNLSNWIEDANPAIRDTFLTALAHEDEDNIYIRKLKNMAEGGLFGLAVDGIGELYTALRAGKQVIKEGGSVEDGVEEVLDIINPGDVREPIDADLVEQYVVEANDLRSLIQDADNADDIAQRNTYLEGLADVLNKIPVQRQLQESDIARRYVDLGQGNRANLDFRSGRISQPYDELDFIDQGRELYNQQFDLSSPEQLAEFEQAKAFFDKPDAQTPWDLLRNEDRQREEIRKLIIDGKIQTPDGEDVITIEWDSQVPLGTGGGRRILRGFNKAFSEMEPGTIVRNTPAGDGFGAGRSGAQDRAAGINDAITPERTREAQLKFKLDLNGVFRQNWESYWKEAFDGKPDEMEAYIRNNSRPAQTEAPAMVKAKKEYVERALPYYLKQFAGQDTEENILKSWNDMTFEERFSRAEDLGQYTELGKFDVRDGEPVSIRERLYSRVGFGPAGEDDYMYGIVRVDKDGRRWLEPVENRNFTEARERALTPARGAESGYAQRMQEAQANNANSVDRALYEPNERAASTSSDDINDVVASEIRMDAAANPAEGSAAKHLTDADYQAVLASRNSTEALANLIKAASQGVDLDAVIDAAEYSGNTRLLESVEVLKEFIADNTDEVGVTNFDSLRRQISNAEGENPVYMTMKGGIAVRALMLDTANQIKELAGVSRQVDEAGGDAFRQHEMLLDRLEVLAEMDAKQSKLFGQSLQSRQNLPFNARRAMEGDYDLKLEKAKKQIDEMRGQLRNGDPEAISEFQTLADALVLSGGDPGKSLRFWEMWQRAGANGLKSALYNGYLGTTTSQIRNITGNAVNVVLRPIAQAIGFKIQGRHEEARIMLAAFHGFGEMLDETFKIAKMSWDDTAVDSQVVRYDAGETNMSALVDNMLAQAKTDGEKAAAAVVKLQYNMFNHPWARMPTRGLGAVDDAVRTLVARMELKKEAMRHSFEVGNGFKVDTDRYAKLVDLKMDGKGNILDEELLNVTKDVTFQRDLQFLGKDLQDMAEKYGPLKLFLPFIKTPTNVLITTSSYIPGWTRIPGSDRIPIFGQFVHEYRAVMQGNDEAAKALYKGREAIGVLVATKATMLAAAGLITGNGPKDREKREIWLRNNQPNSIKTPFGWVSYETIEPINTILSMAADVTMTLRAGNESLYERSFAQFAYTLAASVTDKSYFKGLADAANMININDPRWGTLSARLALGTANTLILPLAGTRRQLAQLMAPGKQDFDNEIARMLGDAFPGVRNVLGTNRVDILTGKDIGPNAVNHVLNNFTPFDVFNSDNEVARKLAEAGVDVSLSFSDTFKGVDLSVREREQLNKYIAESGLGKKLERLMNKESWKKSYDDWNESNLGLDPSPAWHTAIIREFSTAKRIAKARMLRENPTFAMKVNLTSRQRDLVNSARYTEGEAVMRQLEEIIDY